VSGNANSAAAYVTGLANVGYFTTTGNVTANIVNTGTLFATGTVNANSFTTTSVAINSTMVSVSSSNVALLSANQNLAGGFTVTPYNIGAVISSPLVPDFTKGQYQYGGANSAININCPAADGGCDILITNGTGAGAITMNAAFVAVAPGDSYATTAAKKYILSVRRINGVSTYIWKAIS